MKTHTESTSLLTYTICFAVLIVAIEIIGAYWYSPLAWGVNLFHFLPSYWLILFVLLSIGGIILIQKGEADMLIRSGGEAMEKRPLIFIGIVIALYLGAAYLLRVQVPLLGDSFLLINNYIHTFDGMHPLNITREPLSLLYFYRGMDLLGTTTYPEIKDAFFYGEFILGIGLILISFNLVRKLFEEPEQRFLLFLFLLVLPSGQLFFGYVEIYSVVEFSLMFFLFLSVLFFKKKAPFWLVFLAFLFLGGAHILAIILIPALLYLAYIEWKRNSWKNIIAGIMIGVLLGLSIYYTSNDAIDRIFPPETTTHYLSPFPVNDGTQAYTLLSPYHFLELTNSIFLAAPFGLFLLFIIAVRNKKSFIDSPINIFLSLSVLLFIGFLSVAKYDLGASKDWDVTAPWFVMVQLFLGYLFLREGAKYTRRAFACIILVTALHSGHWFILNASAEAPVARAASLFDERVFSRSAYYNSTMHLAKYYYNNGEDETSIGLWKNFNATYPGFPNGYENLIAACKRSKVNHTADMEDALQRWIAAAPYNTDVPKIYSQFCLRVADTELQNKNNPRAWIYYQKAITNDSTCYQAYNDLGKIANDSGHIEEAIGYIRKCVTVNPAYTEGYMNLGNLWSQKRDYKNAIPCYQHVLSNDSTRTDAYTFLANAFTALQEKASAEEVLRIKERKGKK